MGDRFELGQIGVNGSKATKIEDASTHLILHCPARHVGISFDMGCLSDSAWTALRRPGQDAGASADCS